MVKILFVSTSTTVGGAEKTLYSLATRINRGRFSVAGVVSLKPAGLYAQRLRDQGIAVSSLEVKGLPSPADVRRLSDIIERERPQIVHAVMYQAIQLARLAKLTTSFPFKLIASPRVNYRSRSWPTLTLDRWLKNGDDLLISECEASRRFLLTKLGYAPEKVAVIRNGVDASGWPFSKIDRQNKRLSLSLTPGETLIGAVGRLDEQKGFETLIEAMAQLQDLPVRCAIIGDGPRRRALEKMVRRYHLDSTVWLPGEQTSIGPWLSAFDLYCLPSLWEGLPNSLLEAMALGLPIVACDVDGVPEAASDGRDALLVPPASPIALARALRALATDPERRARLGAAAKETARERFALPRMIHEYERAYEDVLARG